MTIGESSSGPKRHERSFVKELLPNDTTDDEITKELPMSSDIEYQSDDPNEKSRQTAAPDPLEKEDIEVLRNENKMLDDK